MIRFFAWNEFVHTLKGGGGGELRCFDRVWVTWERRSVNYLDCCKPREKQTTRYTTRVFCRVEYTLKDSCGIILERKLKDHEQLAGPDAPIMAPLTFFEEKDRQMWHLEEKQWQQACQYPSELRVDQHVGIVAISLNNPLSVSSVGRQCPYPHCFRLAPETEPMVTLYDGDYIRHHLLHGTPLPNEVISLVAGYLSVHSAPHSCVWMDFDYKEIPSFSLPKRPRGSKYTYLT